VPLVVVSLTVLVKVASRSVLVAVVVVPMRQLLVGVLVVAVPWSVAATVRT
jgi:hypothetical protein